MCGIFGYLDHTGTSMPDSALRRMGEVIQYRGPDDKGFFHETGIGLGNQRLAIIDVEHGHQPFVSDDGDIVVVQNGEIFNHVEIARDLSGEGVVFRTHSDTEAILRLYEQGGIGALERLNGMFAIAIYDRREGKLFVIRDRIGIKPLYYHYDGSRFTFGSEIKSLFAGGVKPLPNFRAVHSYLVFNYVPQPETIFSGVQHVKPGHFLEISANGVSEHRWWDLARCVPEEDRSEEDWMEEFNATLDDAVRIRLRCDVPFGAFLSGGVDSSSVVGLMSRHMSDPVKTFCIGFSEKRFDESPYAAMAAKRFGTEHICETVSPHMLQLWPKTLHHCDQPHGDISFLPTYKVAELASRHVKVVLTGDGGDELFAGYDKYVKYFGDASAFTDPDASFRASYFDSISLFPESELQELYQADMRKRVEGFEARQAAEAVFDRYQHQDRINQALAVDMELLLSGNNLVKPDRMGMAVSLEARAPFLDYRMMELAFRMPGQHKLRNGESKHIFKKAVTPLIGEELAYRRKQMFTVPVGEWFRNELRSYGEALLFSGNAWIASVMNMDRVRGMWNDHLNGRRNMTREIRALMALEIWARNELPDTDPVPLVSEGAVV